MASPPPFFVFFLLIPLLQEAFTSSALASGAAKAYIVRVDHNLKPSIFPTTTHWYTTSLLSSPSDHLLHVYSTVFHGFSAVLSPTTRSVVSAHPAVLALFPDRRRYLHTTRSPQFLGLRNQHGLWSDSDYGSDVFVGVLDTGVWPERRSFSDHNLPPIPPRWRGSCDFPGQLCNRKLVGARSFSRGHDAAAALGGPAINDTVEYRSPRDADGHGTHTASTAAGRYAFRASMSGYAEGIAKGVAPKARIAAYKVCWRGSGCLDSDILAAFDQAVADGVDVLSVSIGGGNGAATPYYLDPIAVGSYGAVNRGVFVAVSAGNDGPSAMSVTNVAPWMATVGAGTIDRTFPADVLLGDGRRLSGISLYSGRPLDPGKSYPLIYPGKTGGMSSSLCMENSLDQRVVSGSIVLCDRGSNPRVAKGVVVRKAGGIGMVLANGLSNGEGLVGDAHVLPACAVGADEGDVLKAYASSSANPTATIVFHGTVVGVKPAPVVASFSGRGPNGLTPGVLKPDFVAPGVNILAAWTDAAGPTGLDSDSRRTEFNILSGTSMACPHASGAAALLKSKHPDWSPAAIRSAMMTTASVKDNQRKLLIDESTGRSSTPLDFGAGHIHLDRAMDPGLVYDLSGKDYVDFLCAIGYNSNTMQVITHKPERCPQRKKKKLEDFNYPSFSVVLDGTGVGNGSETKVYRRTVTNVGGGRAEYRAKVEMASGNGVTVMVRPWKLVFAPGEKKKSFVVKVKATVGSTVHDSGGVVFGFLTWSDGRRLVRSPIVVSRIMPLGSDPTAVKTRSRR